MKEKMKKILKASGLSVGSLTIGILGTILIQKLRNKDKNVMTEEEIEDYAKWSRDDETIKYIDWMLDCCSKGKGIIAGYDEVDENGNISNEKWIIGELVVGQKPDDLPCYIAEK